jgi:hypothetical protein
MFTRVDQKHAGATALGILVPQGAKTLVIIRPRALAWDLLPARWDGAHGNAPEFCVFPRDEAASAARRLIQALEAAINNRVCPVETFGDAQGKCCQVWMRTDEFVWIACRRATGEAYRPMIFATQEEAIREAEALAAIVWPTAETKQEYYFNTQNFS